MLCVQTIVQQASCFVPPRYCGIPYVQVCQQALYKRFTVQQQHPRCQDLSAAWHLYAAKRGQPAHLSTNSEASGRIPFGGTQHQYQLHSGHVQSSSAHHSQWRPGQPVINDARLALPCLVPARCHLFGFFLKL
jgi:hypothetical protein